MRLSGEAALCPAAITAIINAVAEPRCISAYLRMNSGGFTVGDLFVADDDEAGCRVAP